MERIKVEAREDGFVETLFGRRIIFLALLAAIRRCAVLQNGRQSMRPFKAVLPISSSGRWYDSAALCEAGFATKMLLQVHDELIFEGPESEAEAATA